MLQKSWKIKNGKMKRAIISIAKMVHNTQTEGEDPNFCIMG